MLTREAILAKKDLRREKVHVQEWGGDVWVRELTGGERARYEAGFTDTVAGDIKNQDIRQRAKRFEDMRAKVIAMATVNQDGTRIFKDEDVGEINELSGAALDKLASVIMRLSGYTTDEQERIKKKSLDPDSFTSDLH